ncbi:lipopolysaccharide assembly protein LapA domain-containing protein [Metallumcola ferriviriculae]|uniref:Lipopolysaccharide assembly protein LapA domain-containing protein n=1 Tax=Metallumcola ferriviriculae TaxID=3039180 RepID=A0AAU0UV84_9FIRM|nr:lipopolysaccharide assembly protein LapA domain-containing protein [Desulfitibacteraceae bacterium MK1]
MQFYLVSALLFALLVAIFAVQNTELVTINFLAWQFKEISLVLVILGSSVIGAVFLFFLGMVKQFSQYRSNKELTVMNKQLTEENQLLKKELEALSKPHSNEEDQEEVDIQS